MRNIENCVGEKLLNVMITPNTDYSPSDGEILADEINFIFDNFRLEILPVIDTDEVTVELYSEKATKRNTLQLPLSDVDKYRGKKLSMIWECINTRGYFDLLIVGLIHLHPSLLILSEGGVLKLFEAKDIKKRDVPSKQ